VSLDNQRSLVSRKFDYRESESVGIPNAIVLPSYAVITRRSSPSLTQLLPGLLNWSDLLSRCPSFVDFTMITGWPHDEVDRRKSQDNSWPSSVRELRNVLETLCLLRGGKQV